MVKQWLEIQTGGSDKKEKIYCSIFYSFSEQPMYKTVNADDSQQAVAKFQEAVKWDYNTIGTIIEENEKK